MAEAEEGSRGVVQACHVLAKGGLGFDVLGERVSGVLFAVDVEENDDLARDELLKETDTPRDIRKRRLIDDASLAARTAASLSHQMRTVCCPRTPKDTKARTLVTETSTAPATEAANISAAAVSTAVEC